MENLKFEILGFEISDSRFRIRDFGFEISDSSPNVEIWNPEFVISNSNSRMRDPDRVHKISGTRSIRNNRGCASRTTIAVTTKKMAMRFGQPFHLFREAIEGVNRRGYRAEAGSQERDRPDRPFPRLSLTWATKQARRDALEQEMNGPTFWNDQEKAKAIIQELKTLNAVLKPFEELGRQADDLEASIELAEEVGRRRVRRRDPPRPTSKALARLRGVRAPLDAQRARTTTATPS